MSGAERIAGVARRALAVATRPLPFLLRLVTPFPVAWIFLTDPGINGFFASRFEDAVHGRSFQPYVYRALVPWTAHFLTGVFEGLRRSAENLFHASILLATLRAKARVSVASSLELLIFAILVIACLHVLAGSLRRACRRLYEGPPLVAELVPVVALVFLPSLFSYNNYVYDPGTWLFSALALEALVAARFWWFVAVVSAGFYNKETIVLFVPIFAVHAWGKLPLRRYAAMLAVLVAGFALSRIILDSLFSKQFGFYTIPQLLDHNLKLLRSYPVATVTAWLALALLVFGHWSRKPAVLKLALLCHLPLFGACLIWGYFDELRDYYEVYPILVLLMAPTVTRAMGVELREPAAPCGGT